MMPRWGKFVSFARITVGQQSESVSATVIVANMASDEDGTILGPESLKDNFNSLAYLYDFYDTIDDPAMQMMLMLLPNIAFRMQDCDSLLDFGAGPTIHVAVTFRNKVKNIYLADHLPQNRLELWRWVSGTNSFDWKSVLKRIATIEGNDWSQLDKIEAQTRSMVRAIYHCDCHTNPSVAAPERLQSKFDVVVTILCLEYSCKTMAEYVAAVKNVTDQVKPGGTFIMGGVMEETWCSFGGHKFACLYLTENLLFRALRECNLLVDDPKSTIYYNASGMFLISTRKRENVKS